ncbi:hypothetical protein L1S34_07270 [Flavobacterium sp. K77]|uniref:Lipoprotein n=1 Tax=Flavobacterium turcicum TaxID=2764718 RepID=A0ABR7JJJ3_9FLAO|nr:MULTISPECIES: hypothetical protein [Flavobacterium]MBC5864659.1 hypothetical protein [Flavobacterium turcicum]MCF6141081.1 hypothetical protein [Flavobacterium sp. K77]NHL03393.1 hypothetical protein [Flavobacterium turcicum]
MKNIIFLLAILLFSCNFKKETKAENIEMQNVESVIKEPKITGEKYFEYDEIEYYQNEIEEDQIEELYDNQKKSVKDSLKMGVILGEIPKSITDTNFIDNLKSFGYTKSKIEPKKFDKIDEIFTEKKHSESYATACIYIYRDILIFKRKSKIIGIAKICFGCDANVIVGTKSNTEEFGMSGDYQKLRKILTEK